MCIFSLIHSIVFIVPEDQLTRSILCLPAQSLDVSLTQ